MRTDGANLELFATGLQNPQELAFDELGNPGPATTMATGDRARWTLVLEEQVNGPNGNGPRKWVPGTPSAFGTHGDNNTAAYLVPPVAYVEPRTCGHRVPSGTGLGTIPGHLLHADFREESAPSESNRTALFRMAAGPGDNGSPTWLQDNSVTNQSGKLWDLYPVDVTFPPDGGVVVADWVEGREKTGKGRLWRVTDPQLAHDPAIAETRRLLAEGMTHRKNAESRVPPGQPRLPGPAQCPMGVGRTGYQFLENAFPNRPGKRTAALRLHAVWGLGQLNRAFGAGSPDCYRFIAASFPTPIRGFGAASPTPWGRPPWSRPRTPSET